MVIFNELRICEDGSALIIDCEIENLEMYSEMYIESIDIDYYKNVDASGIPTTKSHNLYTHESGDNIRNINIKVSEATLESVFGIESLTGALFFVTVKCDGKYKYTELSGYCGNDVTTQVGAIPDWQYIYSQGIQYLHLAFDDCHTCEFPYGMEQWALLWEAMRLAIATCDWERLISYWNRFVGSPKFVVSYGSGGCGCSK